MSFLNGKKVFLFFHGRHIWGKKKKCHSFFFQWLRLLLREEPEVSDGRNLHLRSTQSVYLLPSRPSSHPFICLSVTVSQSKLFPPDAFNPTASSGAAVQTKQNLFLLFFFVAVVFFFLFFFPPEL